MELQRSTFKFLQDLSVNNNREWFNANKDLYLQAHENVLAFVEDLLAEMHQHDLIETPSAKKSLMRIYRDVRFSKNKQPYKTYFGGRMKRATDALRGGYYYHLEPGNTFIAGGFYGPNSDDLMRIRKEFQANDSEIRDILNEPEFKKTFGELQGNEVKTAPRGFSQEHEAIDLIRKKQFYVTYAFADKEVLSRGFHQKVSDTYRIIRPFFDYMSDVLTTDLNGRSIL